MGGRHMPAEHLPTPATIQADDMIAVNGSPDRNRGGSLDDGFWCRLTEATERLMNSRDQWGELIRLDLIASNIGGDDLGGEFGRLLVGHFRAPQLDWQRTIAGRSKAKINVGDNSTPDRCANRQALRPRLRTDSRQLARANVAGPRMNSRASNYGLLSVALP
jgi:hypothetical protein